ncbi:TonB-dependent receptor [Solimicrobium silvestre]|uniref:TonB-dependent Receptor Plug Domain n=1 Tax=Solimicrobium silvestre TaxID=2099400 RepID=A0A2S9GVW5_9BURK|nr:TonB-dependent receptor [Solimicrobium silvestre]PRC91863.1 TonB-dependent Receptor Plug Domain [Solimicrobium silvestre]
MKFRQKNLAFSISLALLTGALGGTATTANAAEQTADNPAPAPAASAPEDASIAVITITAQNRSQQMQEVPISLQVITNDQITKLAANNLSDLNGYIPGLVVNGSQPTQPGYSIRGIGTGDFGIGTDSPVGIYVDGVYTGKTGGALMNFNDVERVEVLKGPQGTLFGRNSAAGAISVVTKGPSNEFENDANIRFGQYGERNVDAMLNVPLSDTVALRFTFVDNKSRGWLNDSATGESMNDTGDWGTRATLRWNAPGHTKVIFSWEHESLNQDARPDIGLVPLALQTPAPPFPANPNTYLNPITAPAYNNSDGNLEKRLFNGATLRVEYPFEWGTFDSTTAYRHFNSSNIESNTGSNLVGSYLTTGNLENNTTWQQEFKLSGKNDTVDWLTGVSMFSESAQQTSQVNLNTDTLNNVFNNLYSFPVYGLLNDAAVALGIPVKLFGNSWQENMFNSETSKSYAIYGDAIWHVAPKLNLTTGVRFSYDSKNFSWYNPPRVAPGVDTALATLNQVNFFPNLVQAGAITQAQANQVIGAMTQNIEYGNALSLNAPYSMSNSWTDVSPRVVLDYKLSPDVMVYGSVTKGYQSGGFNAQLVAGAYQPEIVWNYEAGLKSYFPEQHLLINSSLFLYKFSNLQSLSLVPSGSPIPQYQVTSSNQSAVGVDTDVRWQPTHNLRMFAVAEYIDQDYGNYTAADGTNLNNQPTGTPLWTIAGGADYTQRNIWDGSINYSLQHAYTGPVRCNADAVAQGACLSTPTFTLGGSTQRTDGRIGWDAGNHKWGVAVYVNNLFNNRYVTGIDNTALTVLGTPAANISAPRIVGMQLHVSL